MRFPPPPRKSHPSDLTDEQRLPLEPLLSHDRLLRQVARRRDLTAEEDHVEGMPEADPRLTSWLGGVRLVEDRLDDRPQRVFHFPDRLQRLRNGYLALPGFGLQALLQTSIYRPQDQFRRVTYCDEASLPTATSFRIP